MTIQIQTANNLPRQPLNNAGAPATQNNATRPRKQIEGDSLQLSCGPKQRAPHHQPAAFGYQTQFAHDAKELAQEFGVSRRSLMKLNGWTDKRQQVAAGSAVNVVDTEETRSRAATYGGQVTAPAPVEQPAPTGDAKPAAPAEDGQAPAQDGEAPAGPAAGGIGIPGDPNRVHMTQFVDARFNPSPNAPLYSANCGPASLAMGLKAVGLQPPGLPEGADPEAWIDASREAMGAMYDAAGRYGDHAYTDIGEVIQGAQASGAETAPVTFDNLDEALAQGLPVVAAGNPVFYNGDWVQRGLANSQYDGGHFITVVGKDVQGNYLINDPLSVAGTVAINPAEMQGYMGYFGPGSAVSIRNPA
jgi:hypothetical protein